MSLSYPRAATLYENFRNQIWAGALSTVSARRVGAPFDEMELQACWFGGEYGRSFIGTEGETIEIVQFGTWNRGSGPDFTEAAVRVNGVLYHGPIEIDPDARDWEHHGHGENPDFDSVILHVFTDTAASKRVFTRTLSHRNVPQVLLPQYSGLRGAPDFLPEAFPGRCLVPLAQMEEPEIGSLLSSAAQYRLRQKAERLHVMATTTTTEQALYQAFAEALGFGRNKTAMAILAQRCPLKKLRPLPSLEREALLFGVSGFLRPDLSPSVSSGDPESQEYQRALWDHWWRIRDQAESIPRRAIQWRTDGTRPLNHPQRRLGALVSLLSHWEEVHIWCEEPQKKWEQVVNNWSKTLSHRFWSRHYTLLSDPSPKALRLIGQDRVRDILGNVLFPAAIRVHPDQWDQYIRLAGVAWSHKLRRACLRLFGQDKDRQKLFTRYYHQQQGLLQIYDDFCLADASDCADCPFPEQLLQWKMPRFVRR